MIGQRDGAIDAFHALSAGAAGSEARKSPAVEQQHGLLAFLKALGHHIHQASRENGKLAGFEKFLAHVDDFDIRHGPLLDALGKGDESVLAALGVVAALEAGCGRAEDRYRSCSLGAHDGYVAAVVARRVLLLVALVMFLVNHHQAEILYRSENTRPRPHHHGRGACPDPAPLFGALGIVKRGMQNGHAPRPWWWGRG